MELENPSNGENQTSETYLRNPNNGETQDTLQNQLFNEEIDSSCSTPYVSAPSSPGRGSNGYFFSAPASPMHFILSSSSAPSSSSSTFSSTSDHNISGSYEFEFSARFSTAGSTASGSMISADELFLNGKIRPMKLSSHLQRPQNLAPLLDVEEEEEENKEFSVDRKEFVVRGRDLRLRNRSMQRRARSMSPLRNETFQWQDEQDRENKEPDLDFEDPDLKQIEPTSTETTPSVSASSSRSSSSGRNSKRWIFLKDFLYRSKSEGRGNSKEKFWSSISFSPSKEKKPNSSLPFSTSKEKKPISSSSLSFSPSKQKKTEIPKPKKMQQVPAPAKKSAGKPANVIGKRRVPPSPHELLYTANLAQSEEMKKRTFLPYRQGLLGCLGFSSKSYGAMNVFAKTLNPVSSR
ncbi:stress response NST1-like protein (DUF1645) [Tasmannia lanceolata]|uniref:stress response NST1-like protein (DUF1645) n=1 Tax=Tasmannia lanceolata TaxID=3420 RepID=UPI004063AC21